MSCNHDIAEQESAVTFDSLCPICLHQELKATRRYWLLTYHALALGVGLCGKTLDTRCLACAMMESGE